MIEPGIELRRDFADRAELDRYLGELFPEAEGNLAQKQGGERAARAALAAFVPDDYARTRNHLDGAVSRLSAYLRHGLLTLSEVHEHAVAAAAPGESIESFVRELAWRDYFQRVYAAIGEGVWVDREPLKTGFASSDYVEELPPEVAAGTTGLACIDAFVGELKVDGYLHNHARLWLAAYLIHWRRVRWQTGARWFLRYLLDGDPASNNLSWQWVASSFSVKPYFFNRENLEQFTAGRFCAQCPERGHCPMEGTYPELGLRLFPNLPPESFT